MSSEGEFHFRGRARGFHGRFRPRPFWGRSRGGGFRGNPRRHVGGDRQVVEECAKCKVVKEMTTNTTQTERESKPIAVEREVPLEGFPLGDAKLYILAEQPTLISFSEYVEVGRQLQKVNQKMLELEAENRRLKSYMSPEPSKRKVQKTEQTKLSPGELSSPDPLEQSPNVHLIG